MHLLSGPRIITVKRLTGIQALNELKILIKQPEIVAMMNHPRRRFQVKYRNVNLRIPQLEFNVQSDALRDWLPSKGNALFTIAFTLAVIASLLWAQSVGALNLGTTTAGASTSTIAYQGRLADSDGTPLTETLNMSFRLYAQVSGGAPLWTEQWTGSNGVQVSDGLFNVMLGSLEPIPQNIITGNENLFLGITVGTDGEMSPRVQLGSVPFAVQALTVPDGSITTEKIADGSVTLNKLHDVTEWTDLPLSSEYHTAAIGDYWQRAQYRRVGDIVYLRGLVVIDSGSVVAHSIFTTLPAGFRPPKALAFVTEPHNWLTTKHRIDVYPNGQINAENPATDTRYISLDGILFSTTQ